MPRAIGKGFISTFFSKSLVQKIFFCSSKILVKKYFYFIRNFGQKIYFFSSKILVKKCFFCSSKVLLNIFIFWKFDIKRKNTEDPILAYNAAGEINTVHWGPIHNDWIAITYDHTLEILRV